MKYCSSCQTFRHHQSVLNYSELLWHSEVACVQYKAQIPWDPTCFPSVFLQFWCSFLTGALFSLFKIHFPLVVHVSCTRITALQGLCSRCPIIDCLKISLGWVVPQSLLLIWTSAPWALGLLCKRIWSSNLPLLWGGRTYVPIDIKILRILRTNLYQFQFHFNLYFHLGT